MRDPDTGQLMNQLRWQPWTEPHAWQPYPTVFQLADAAGVHTCQVSAPTFAETPLTKVALSGGTFHGRLTGEERMDLAAEQLGAAGRSLVYTYYSEVDGKGHRFGVDSPEWRDQLRYVDGLAQRLAERLPPRAALYVTADHGMIDIPFDPESRIDFDEDWELRAGVSLLGGEGRARHVYAVPGAAGDVLAVWREVLGERMWVAGRDEAIEAGWFGGPGGADGGGKGVDDRVYRRIGDIVAAARDDIAIVASHTEPKESAMVGLHGSMTPWSSWCRSSKYAPERPRSAPPRSLPPVHARPGHPRPTKGPASPCPSWCSFPERWTAERAPSLCRSSTTARRAGSRG
ncbi:hypothetical protein SVIO_078420 [Streptomyces violaceusniger]|uniref:Phosphodiesterase n=1 Tax=Streptomyces violaceusniger TaxID=68280 RepID=A0A4D4LH36_STRVO|nr:hypothetical protein SVIO_078420 [Streptomyces violaceusniger]